MCEEFPNAIVIAGNRYSVHQLSEAQRIIYWECIDDLAKQYLNPWKDLHEKIKDLPMRLQEIVFVSAPKSLFPLNRRQQTEICCGIEAIDALVDVSLDISQGLSVEAIESALAMHKTLHSISREDLLQVYIDLIGLLGDSYTGKEKPAEPERQYTGLEAIGHLRGVMADEEKAMNPPTREMKVPPPQKPDQPSDTIRHDP